MSNLLGNGEKKSDRLGNLVLFLVFVENEKERIAQVIQQLNDRLYKGKAGTFIYPRAIAPCMKLSAAVVAYETTSS